MNDLFDQPRTKASSGSNSPSTENGPPEIKTGEHACTICGAPAHFGFDVKLRAGITGRWACSGHREVLKQLHLK
jgi:hypothetical protein